LTGNVHNKDGSQSHFPEGHKIGGVNHWAQIHNNLNHAHEVLHHKFNAHHHESHIKKMLKKKFKAHMQKHKDDKKELEDAEKEAKNAEAANIASKIKVGDPDYDGKMDKRKKAANPYTGRVHNADGS